VHAHRCACTGRIAIERPNQRCSPYALVRVYWQRVVAGVEL
jgi:hypothetical protein